MRALLDTSFFVAAETGRPISPPAGVDETEVSVVTVAELTVGVLLADESRRDRRLATLAAVESGWEPLPVDIEVARAFARAFARIVASLRARSRRVPVLDALIAATASARDIPVVTQDRDFQAIPGIVVVRL
ncbi:MAG TPA: PIN domain-containing protein [Candidatus Micrarchaeia archaeon]|nr:PIN domain-containing protein [Candidatus Micrarchaeia archaeon]